jgi:hypothetical protein
MKDVLVGHLGETLADLLGDAELTLRRLRVAAMDLVPGPTVAFSRLDGWPPPLGL